MYQKGLNVLGILFINLVTLTETKFRLPFSHRHVIQLGLLLRQHTKKTDEEVEASVTWHDI
jgi:hypothetical protein